jgi:hypothetical protein
MEEEEEEEVCSPDFPPGDIKQLLSDCAAALSENKMDDFDRLIEKASGVVLDTGEPIHRLGAYVVQGLKARKLGTGIAIYYGLDSIMVPKSKQILNDICPCIKYGLLAACGVIAKEMLTEERIHIIDFQIGMGKQWMHCLRWVASWFATRNRDAPHVRITGIDIPENEGLEEVARQFAAISVECKIPIEFEGVRVHGQAVTLNMLNVRPGESLFVNFPMLLRCLPDESVDVNNPRDRLLRMVKSLSPKLVTLVEEQSGTNRITDFLNRFDYTLDYYLPFFESIRISQARNIRDRLDADKHCLGRDIVNIIACEGKERVVRQELHFEWKSRFTSAGFRQYSLRSFQSEIKGHLRSYSPHYNVIEMYGTLLLSWKSRTLISASAWH